MQTNQIIEKLLILLCILQNALSIIVQRYRISVFRIAPDVDLKQTNKSNTRYLFEFTHSAFHHC